MKFIKQVIGCVLIIVVTSCVQQTQPKIITVKVDMNSILNPTKVGIRGNAPLSWAETTFLNDADGDGVFEETFKIYTANNDIEFKFVNNNNEFELQDQNNRSLTFQYKPESIIYEAIYDNHKEVKITKKQ